jgi:hypothetical protein
MKTKLLTVLGCAILGSWASATEIAPTESAKFSSDQVEHLVGPIALYPDALVALILPASTRPSDIVLAARYLERGGKPAATVTQTWEDSVKSLVHYPEVIALLDENLGWTQELGEAYLDQPEDVMDAIQSLRDRAMKAGLLTDTAQQAIVVEDGVIRIVPAKPTVIYVPRYDPEVLYVTRTRSYHPGPFISFGIGYGIGSWLSYDCNWHHRGVVIVHRSPGWYHSPVWRTRPVYYHASHASWRPWAPAPHVVRRHHNQYNRHRTDPVSRPGHSWSDRRDRSSSPYNAHPERRHPAVSIPTFPHTTEAAVAQRNRARPANEITRNPTRDSQRWHDRQRTPRPEVTSRPAPSRETHIQSAGERHRPGRDTARVQGTSRPHRPEMAAPRPARESQRIASAPTNTVRPVNTARPESAARPQHVTRTESSDDRNPLREAH